MKWVFTNRHKNCINIPIANDKKIFVVIKVYSIVRSNETSFLFSHVYTRGKNGQKLIPTVSLRWINCSNV